MKNLSIFIFLLFLLFAVRINAWVYPEHREIALRAVESLPLDYRTLLDSLWQQARVGYESRLCETVIDPLQTIELDCLDFAAWSAISGDHSCSSENMLDVVLNSDWILDVARINAELKVDLAVAERRDQVINSLRKSDLRLQKADPEYATRAGSNNVHFLLSLHDVHMTMDAYIDSCLAEGVEINSIGAYYIYHISALKKASKLVYADLSVDERSKLILSALADEAFAQHFLEDMFAAGHAAGTWGNVSQRKGTHDYYNEHGLKAVTWQGEKTVLMGDAWMKDNNANRAAKAVSKSLRQVLDAAEGKLNFEFIKKSVNSSPLALSTCKTNNMPDLEISVPVREQIELIIIDTPVPALAKGLGDLPRFRAEVGPFIGFSPSLRGSMVFGGFSEAEQTLGFVGGLAADARFGVGLDGVLNESGDGLIYLALGWRQDGASSTRFFDADELDDVGNIGAAIPGRSSYSARLRLPFYILPLDLLIAGPFLLFIDSEALTNMAVTAVNGGLIPWQSGLATSFGRLQFVLGREIAVSFFGAGQQKDALFITNLTNLDDPVLLIVSYQSTQIELPILEYQPFRSFSEDQSSSMLIQLYGGVDIPHNVETPGVDLDYEIKFQNVWFLGARVVFDWRHYF